MKNYAIIILAILAIGVITGHTQKINISKQTYPLQSYGNKLLSSHSYIFHTFNSLSLANNTTIVASPAMYDIDGDGAYELIIPTNYSLIALKYNSTSGDFYRYWECKIQKSHIITMSPGVKNYTEQYEITTHSVFADFDGDGKIEIAIGTNDSIVFVSEAGELLKIVKTNYTVLDIIAMDANMDGAIDVVAKLDKSSDSIVYVNYYYVTGSLPTLSYVEVYQAKGRLGLITYPDGSKIVHRAIYFYQEVVRAIYRNGSIVKKDDIDLNANQLFVPFVGNYTNSTFSDNKAEVFVILKNDTFDWIKFPPGVTPIIMSKTLTAITYETLGKKLNISTQSILVNPVVADFDSDGKDEVFLWFNYTDGSENKTLIAFLGVDNVTQKTVEFYAKNITLINTTPLSSMVLQVNGNQEVYTLLSNGTILAIYYNNSEISIDNLGTAPNATYILAGDIDADGNSEIIAIGISNGTILTKIYDVQSSTSWNLDLGGQYYNGHLIYRSDYDHDGLFDSQDPNITDSDVDHDQMNDYVEEFLGLQYTNPDFDNDGLPDGWERRYGLSPKTNDTDQDGVSDAEEDNDYDFVINLFEYGNSSSPLKEDTDADGIVDFDEINGTLGIPTDPASQDTDNDGIPDKEEFNLGLDPTNITDGSADLDNDGLTNFGEYTVGTNITNPDTDGDLMLDGFEVYYGLDPLDPKDYMADPDNDGLVNAQEYQLGTDPNKNDTDADGMPDGWEWTYGLNPVDASDNTTDPDNDALINVFEYGNNTNPLRNDTDLDGMPDGWELKYEFDPINPNDAYGDKDHDYLLNKDEYKYNTSPINPDTDNDSLVDGLEIRIGTDPHNPDTDGDGLTDGEEVMLGTDPLNIDTDGDGMSDYDEIRNGRNPTKPDAPINSIYMTIIIIGLIIILLSLLLLKKWSKLQQK